MSKCGALARPSGRAHEMTKMIDRSKQPLYPARIHHPTRAARAGTPVRSRFCNGIVVAAFLLLCASAYAQKKSSCIECHSKLDDTRLSAPAKLFDNDIHRSRGLSCNDCHGGDPNADTKEAAKDPRKGYLANQKRSISRLTAASVIAKRI